MSFRVLYVDDEPALCRVFRRIFEGDARVEVTCAQSPGRALQLVKEQPFDVVVTDLKMPGIDGIELLSYVAHTQPRARRVLVSAHADLEAMVRAVNRAGIDRVLAKPWDLQEVRDAVVGAGTRAAALDRLRTQTEELAQSLRATEQQLARRTGETIEALTSALELREPGSLVRARRVAREARRLGQEMGLAGGALDDLEWGAMLADIGKLALPAQPDWCELVRHPLMGYRMLERTEFLEGARRIVLSHHERYDGSGFPSGLRGDQIALGARILAVVQMADELEGESARWEIQRQAGAALDPIVAAAWLRLNKTLMPALRAV